MTITLEILAEQIIVLESAGDQSRDSELEEEDVILLIKQVAGNLIAQGLGAKIMNDDMSTEHHFIHVFENVEVEKDSSTELYYTTLPSVPFALPENRGVKEIYAGTNYDKPMMPMPMGSVSFFKDALVGEIGYSIEKDRVWFYNVKKKIPSVTIRIVAANPDDITNDEQFYLPTEMQAQVIQEVRNILQSESPRDETNDSKDIP